MPRRRHIYTVKKISVVGIRDTSKRRRIQSSLGRRPCSNNKAFRAWEGDGWSPFLNCLLSEIAITDSAQQAWALCQMLDGMKCGNVRSSPTWVNGCSWQVYHHLAGCALAQYLRIGLSFITGVVLRDAPLTFDEITAVKIGATRCGCISCAVSPSTHSFNELHRKRPPTVRTPPHYFNVKLY